MVADYGSESLVARLVAAQFPHWAGLRLTRAPAGGTDNLGLGDPAVDLLPAWTLLTAETRPVFRAEVGVDDATWLRGRGWGLRFGLGAVHVYRDTNPVLAGIGRHALGQVLSDPL